MTIDVATGIARILKQEGVGWVSTFPVCRVNNALGREEVPILMMRDDRYAVAVADAGELGRQPAAAVSCRLDPECLPGAAPCQPQAAMLEQPLGWIGEGTELDPAAHAEWRADLPQLDERRQFAAHRPHSAFRRPVCGRWLEDA